MHVPSAERIDQSRFLAICTHLLFVERLDLRLVRVSKSFLRHIDDVAVPVLSLFCDFVDLPEVRLGRGFVDRDAPVQDADRVESVLRNWPARVVQEALVSWDVVKVVCSHGGGGGG